MALTGNSTRQRESQSVYPQTLYKLSLVSVRLVVHGFCPHLHVCRSLSIHSINYLAVYCFTTILHNALTHSLRASHNSIAMQVHGWRFSSSYWYGVCSLPILLSNYYLSVYLQTLHASQRYPGSCLSPSTGAPSTMYVQFI